jgi:hypothetical protein
MLTAIGISRAEHEAEGRRLVPTRLAGAARGRPTPPGRRDRRRANRFLRTPTKGRHGLRIAAQAIDFVAREG